MRKVRYILPTKLFSKINVDIVIPILLDLVFNVRSDNRLALIQVPNKRQAILYKTIMV